LSESGGAFLKLQIDRPALITWLEDRPPMASTWSDWRSIGGDYYLSGGQRSIAAVSDAALDRTLAESDTQLRIYPTNRAALRELLDSGDEPFLTRVVYDPQRREFVAGSLSYSENLGDYIVFLTVARGAAARLPPDGYGVVVIHNFIWSDEKTTRAAMRLGPGQKSEFMAAPELASAAGAFQAVADEVLTAKSTPPTRNEIDTLK
jgi:hypothetical protein